VCGVCPSSPRVTLLPFPPLRYIILYNVISRIRVSTIYIYINICVISVFYNYIFRDICIAHARRIQHWYPTMCVSSGITLVSRVTRYAVQNTHRTTRCKRLSTVRPTDEKPLLKLNRTRSPGVIVIIIWWSISYCGGRTYRHRRRPSPQRFRRGAFGKPFLRLFQTRGGACTTISIHVVTKFSFQHAFKSTRS